MEKIISPLSVKGCTSGEYLYKFETWKPILGRELLLFMTKFPGEVCVDELEKLSTNSALLEIHSFLAFDRVFSSALPVYE